MDENQYRLEEMKTIRAEINIQIQEMYRLENFALVTIGAVGAALFISPNLKDSSKVFLAFVPAAVILFSWIRTRHIAHLIATMDSYLTILECKHQPVSVSEAVGRHAFSTRIHATTGESFFGWVDFYYAKSGNFFWYRNLIWTIILFSYSFFVLLYLWWFSSPQQDQLVLWR